WISGTGYVIDFNGRREIGPVGGFTNLYRSCWGRPTVLPGYVYLALGSYPRHGARMRCITSGRQDDGSTPGGSSIGRTHHLDLSIPRNRKISIGDIDIAITITLIDPDVRLIRAVQSGKVGYDRRKGRGSYSIRKHDLSLLSIIIALVHAHLTTPRVRAPL